jgi:hypothetical protein
VPILIPRRHEMRRIRIEAKDRRPREGRESPVLPLDPRDPDILRAKRATDSSFRDRRC